MIEDIGVFRAVAKHQSFAKAARELNLSTPVVTRRLARLEKVLQTRLLNRTTRQVTLTESGNHFYHDVNDILEALEASKENVKSLTSHVKGTLKVGIPSAISHYYVSKTLHTFLAKYPDLKMYIVSGVNLIHLLNEGYDVVLYCGELPNSNYHYKKVGTMKKIICASPDYLKKHGTPKQLSDLQAHNCLDHFDLLHHNWKVIENGKLVEIQVSGNVNISNSNDLKNLALSGLGIIHVPHYLIKEELEKGTLVSLLDEHQPVNHTLYAIYPSNKYLTKKTQLFLNYITDLISCMCVRDGECVK